MEVVTMGTRRNLDSQTILNAAAELAEEKGLENVSLLQVAEKLGVKSPSLYNHLSGVQELSTGIAKLALGRLEEAIRSSAVGRSEGDALLAIALAYRSYAKENPELYKAILRFRTAATAMFRRRGTPLSGFCIR
jgi:AcrR family transcriptional regulator